MQEDEGAKVIHIDNYQMHLNQKGIVASSMDLGTC